MQTHDNASRESDPMVGALAATLEDTLRQELTAGTLAVLDRHLDRLGRSRQAEMQRYGDLQERLLAALSALSNSDDTGQRILSLEIRNLRSTIERLQEENAGLARMLRDKEELNATLGERCGSLQDRAAQAGRERDASLSQCQALQAKLTDAVERLAAAEEGRAAALSSEQTLLAEKASLERRMAHMQDSWDRITRNSAS